MEPVTVTTHDPEYGDGTTQELPPNGYVLVCGEQMELATAVAHGNGTIVLTIKRKTPCPKCLGEKVIANSEDGEPWSAWANLPPGSDLAVTMGVVQPMTCPVCKGTGTEA